MTSSPTIQSPVNCKIDSDYTWDDCDCSSTQTGTKHILTPASNGGTSCPPASQLTKTRECTPPSSCATISSEIIEGNFFTKYKLYNNSNCIVCFMLLFIVINTN